jgi:hypothetical protein
MDANLPPTPEQNHKFECNPSAKTVDILVMKNKRIYEMIILANLVVFHCQVVSCPLKMSHLHKISC